MTITIRLAEAEDTPHLKKWLSDPKILRWFPMINEREIEDSVRIWMSYTRFDACLTALVGGEPAGNATLYIQPYKKFAHQCLFSIVVDEQHRGKGVGTLLLTSLIKHAKEKFSIEILHLEVYDGNPAISLYRRLGFKEYGRHPRFIKIEREGQSAEYIDKILMEKYL